MYPPRQFAEALSIDGHADFVQQAARGIVSGLNGFKRLAVLLEPDFPLIGTGQVLGVLGMDVFQCPGLPHMLFKRKATLADQYVEEQ